MCNWRGIVGACMERFLHIYFFTVLLVWCFLSCCVVLHVDGNLYVSACYTF